MALFFHPRCLPLLPVGGTPVPGPKLWNGQDESDIVPAYRPSGGGDKQTGNDS